MIRRLIPLILVTLCALPFVAIAQSANGKPAAKTDAQVSVTDTAAADLAGATALTDEEREVFQLAQQSSDPQLGEQRGGILGLILLILLIVLIVVIVD
jgi:hypothetical protein